MWITTSFPKRECSHVSIACTREHGFGPSLLYPLNGLPSIVSPQYLNHWLANSPYLLSFFNSCNLPPFLPSLMTSLCNCSLFFLTTHIQLSRHRSMIYAFLRTCSTLSLFLDPPMILSLLYPQHYQNYSNHPHGARF